MKKIRYITLILFLSLIVAACGSAEVPENPVLGTTASDFTLDNALGGQTSLADFKDEPVLLYFHMAVG